VILTLPILEVVPATPRAVVVRVGLDGRAFEYDAGQAVLVGNHASETRKPYSIACAPETARRSGFIELLVGTDGDSENGPAFTLERGVNVDVEGPLGAFTFPASPVERRFLFIAGGTGMAPLRAMLQHALLQLPDAVIGLLYSVRTPDDFAFEGELSALADAGRIELRQTVTRAAEARGWRGARGRIGRAELAELVHGPETLCFVCGPRTLVEDMPKLLEELGVARPRIRIEEWS
jgi:ferredoxin-NADP reductase